ncbi:SDR family oxidoreductase [Acidiferrimicrobium sp. IK]|uniref:SDR family NAD(P)-dependent oxidoreductase n=1 Tax=Acidiferrimicrobium sp. IK TaxID=2871700 RepID=UPI0021CB836D|nr:SDR family oxidoreductase [Acidiferrimicrobium sp. IK]MCU4186346.1 SDR family oxidoreductase [Acidiferrimicrobium sp. IK]
MDLELRDKRLVVVGGTSGMGLATASVVAGEGAAVVLIGRSEARAAEALASLPEGCGASVVLGDVQDGPSLDRAMQAAVETLGGLDGLAVFTGTLGHQSLDAADETWTAAFDDVLLGTVRAVRAALPHLTAAGGTIVTTAAYSVRAPDAARLPYASLKAGVAAFTKGVAKDYGRRGVRANCICPGAIETSALHDMRGELAKARGIPYEEALERVMVCEWGLDVALGRPGRPEEVGELAAFLLSPRADYLTGALINIDGGTWF